MNKRGKICVGIGLLLLSAALCLMVYNFISDARAGASAGIVLEQLTPKIEAAKEKNSGSSAESFSGEQSQETHIPDYILNPEMKMPESEIDGQRYIGVLKIPALSLELPVISEWSYPSLKIAPCRYAGSAYLNNMVIAGHNYYSHFGKLKNLSQGDEVIFTDMDGNVFTYDVIGLETFSPFAVDEMVGGDWDLTLFTCTLDTQSRVAVRCELFDE